MTEPPTPPPPRDTGLLVAAGDGTLFRCRIERVGEVEQRRWIFTDVEGRSYIGPPLINPSDEKQLPQIVEQWWKRQKRAGSRRG